MRERGMRLLPWIAGMGLAAGQIVLTSGCSIPRDGRCSGCGGCVVALGGLVGWALLQRRTSGARSTVSEAGHRPPPKG